MKREINFFGVRRIAGVISVLVVIAAIVVVFTMGIERGVQFVGGSEIQVKFKETVNTGELRQAFIAKGFPNATIVRVAGGDEFIIKLKGESGDETAVGSDVAERVEAIFKEVSGESETEKLDLNKTNATDLAYSFRQTNPLGLDLDLELRGEERTIYEDIADSIIAERENRGDFFNEMETVTGLVEQEALKTWLVENAVLGNFIKLKEDTFSPSISAEQTEKALLAIVMALLSILVYVSIRFKVDYALGAIVALVHDVLITLGMFALFKQEFSLPVVAAFLTIVGYSLNDTIVVFDRIRENVKIIKAKPLDEIINRSINQSISRTLLTSLTTLFVVVVLFFFGGVALKSFSFPLLVGIVVGTYSSIYVANPVFHFIEERFYKEK